MTGFIEGVGTSTVVEPQVNESLILRIYGGIAGAVTLASVEVRLTLIGEMQDSCFNVTGPGPIFVSGYGAADVPVTLGEKTMFELDTYPSAPPAQLYGAECWGVGACGVGGPGVIECDGKGGTRCSVDPGGSEDRSSPEICDGIDNNCDGRVDEGLNGQTRVVPGGCTDTTFAAAPDICGRPMEGSRERCVAGEGWKCLAQAEYDFCTAWGDGPNMWPCGGLEDYECGTSTHHPICAPNLTCLFRNNKFLCTRTPVCGEAHPPRCWLPENTGGDPTCFYGE